MYQFPKKIHCDKLNESHCMFLPLVLYILGCVPLYLFHLTPLSVIMICVYILLCTCIEGISNGRFQWALIYSTLAGQAVVREQCHIRTIPSRRAVCRYEWLLLWLPFLILFTRPLLQKKYSLIWCFRPCKPNIFWKHITLAASTALFWSSITKYQQYHEILTQYHQVTTSAALDRPITIKYQSVPHNIDPVPPSTNK